MNRSVSRAQLLHALQEVICALPDCRTLRVDDISPQSRLTSELGVDSISIIELGFNMEQALGVNVRIMDWFEVAAPEHTVESLLEHVTQFVGNSPAESLSSSSTAVLAEAS